MDQVAGAEFESEVLEAQVPVIVDFWAKWCKPCDAIEPHLRAIVAEHAGRVRLVRVDIDAEPAIAARYGVLSLPTVVLVADGEPKVTVYGAQPRRTFERAFEPWL